MVPLYTTAFDSVIFINKKQVKQVAVSKKVKY